MPKASKASKKKNDKHADFSVSALYPVPPTLRAYPGAESEIQARKGQESALERYRYLLQSSLCVLTRQNLSILIPKLFSHRSPRPGCSLSHARWQDVRGDDGSGIGAG